MRDPELVLRAQRAAAALERAWYRWRLTHGLGADPLPPVSSYVGYSLEEPWGQPRVVFGVDAEEAEQLADLLDRNDFAGRAHATVPAPPTGRQPAAPPNRRPPMPPPTGRWPAGSPNGRQPAAPPNGRQPAGSPNGRQPAAPAGYGEPQPVGGRARIPAQGPVSAGRGQLPDEQRNHAAGPGGPDAPVRQEAQPVQQAPPIQHAADLDAAAASEAEATAAGLTVAVAAPAAAEIPEVQEAPSAAPAPSSGPTATWEVPAQINLENSVTRLAPVEPEGFRGPIEPGEPEVVAFRPGPELASYLDERPEPDPFMDAPDDLADDQNSSAKHARTSRAIRGNSIPRLTRPKRPGIAPERDPAVTAAAAPPQVPRQPEGNERSGLAAMAADAIGWTSGELPGQADARDSAI
jgi:hypothetical protein